MDHNQRSGVHGHGITGAHNHAGSAGSDPFYDDVHVAAERFQCVMDCDPGVKVAPTAVEFYGDVGFVLHGRQIFHEALRRDIEAGLRLACPPVDRLLAHNVAVESDFSLVVAGAGHIPELCRRGSLWSSSRAHD